jgi:MinD-like ATPase involved in chromosome partitioning or flagellar assembly
VTVVGVASAKGSPGATTAALTLCAAWGGPALLVEADPAGSDLSYRLPVGGDGARAGVIGFLTETDRSGSADVRDHTVRLPSGPRVLVGPTPSRTGELAGRYGDLATHLTALDHTDVVVDCGRLTPDSPARALLGAFEALVMVTRPLVDGVAHLLARIADAVELLPPEARCYVLVVTDPRDTRSQHEVETLIERAGLPAHILGRIVEDPDGVAMLSGGWSSRLEKSLLIRSARDTARRLRARLAVPPVPPVPTYR